MKRTNPSFFLEEKYLPYLKLDKSVARSNVLLLQLLGKYQIEQVVKKAQNATIFRSWHYESCRGSVCVGGGMWVAEMACNKIQKPNSHISLTRLECT